MYTIMMEPEEVAFTWDGSAFISDIVVDWTLMVVCIDSVLWTIDSVLGAIVVSKKRSKNWSASNQPPGTFLHSLSLCSIFVWLFIALVCLFVCFFNFKKLEAFWLEMSPIFASSWALITYLKLVKLRNESKILVFGYHCLCGISSEHSFHLQ